MTATMTIDNEPAELCNECAEDFGTLPDCRCPFEHWHWGGWCIDVHFEDDGSVHARVEHPDCGEWDTHYVGIDDMDGARSFAAAWAEHVICNRPLAPL